MSRKKEQNWSAVHAHTRTAEQASPLKWIQAPGWLNHIQQPKPEQRPHQSATAEQAARCVASPRRRSFVFLGTVTRSISIPEGNTICGGSGRLLHDHPHLWGLVISAQLLNSSAFAHHSVSVARLLVLLSDRSNCSLAFCRDSWFLSNRLFFICNGEFLPPCWMSEWHVGCLSL